MGNSSSQNKDMIGGCRRPHPERRQTHLYTVKRHSMPHTDRHQTCDGQNDIHNMMQRDHEQLWAAFREEQQMAAIISAQQLADQRACWMAASECSMLKFKQELNQEIKQEIEQLKVGNNNNDKDTKEMENKLKNICNVLQEIERDSKSIITKNGEIKSKLNGLNTEKASIYLLAQSANNNDQIQIAETKIKELKREYQDSMDELDQTNDMIVEAQSKLQEQSHITSEIARNLSLKNDALAKQSGIIVSKIALFINGLNEIIKEIEPNNNERDAFIAIKKEVNQNLDDLQFIVRKDKELVNEFRNQQDRFEQCLNRLLRQKVDIAAWTKEIIQNVSDMNELLHSLDKKFVNPGFIGVS